MVEPGVAKVGEGPGAEEAEVGERRGGHASLNVTVFFF
jgi:hypothetical protein